MKNAKDKGKAPVKILVIEDEEATRYSIVWALKKGNFEVIEASTAREGLSKVNQNPDLIILDVQLPDLSGFEVCQILRQDPLSASIPVLHMSASYSTSADKTQGLEAGADAYLVHPVEVPELLATVNALLRVRHSEAIAKKSSRQWETTFDAIRDGVCVVDADLALVKGNDAFRQIFPQARPKQKLSEIALGWIKESKEIAVGQRWFEADFSAMEEGGAVCTFRDITERLKADRELHLAKKNAEEANLSKSRFLANMSHEIRTPLGAIVGFTQLLREGQTTEDEQLQYLETVHRNSQNLALLIDDILDLSKVEAEKMEFETIPVNVETILKDVIDLLSLQAKIKGLTIELDYDPSIPSLVLTDPARLRQILVNIAGNAIKFTSHGTIKIKAIRRHEHIVFDIRDSGKGIAENEQWKLFQPFSQADSTTTREYGGTGLGLILSRQLAHGLGGNVRLVSSRAGEGSHFEILVRLVESDGVIDAKKVERSKVMTSLEGIRILIVDDSSDNRLLLRRILSRQKAITAEAENGKEALAMADDFDIVLLDIQMPVLDGYETAKQLRARGYTAPIIALTAHAMSEERDRCLDIGCSDYLTKPIEIDKLLSSIRFAASTIEPSEIEA